jgi:hypothetical protein
VCSGNRVLLLFKLRARCLGIDVFKASREDGDEVNDEIDDDQSDNEDSEDDNISENNLSKKGLEKKRIEKLKRKNKIFLANRALRIKMGKSGA